MPLIPATEKPCLKKPKTQTETNKQKTKNYRGIQGENEVNTLRINLLVILNMTFIRYVKYHLFVT